MTKKSYILLLLCLFLTGVLLYAKKDDSLFVQAKNSKLRKDPSKESKNDVPVDRGKELKEMSFKKNWYKVKIAGTSTEGWIYQGKVTKGKITEDASLTKGGTANPKIGEELAAGSAIRGLGPVSQKFADRNKVTDRHKRFADYHQSYICVSKSESAPNLTEPGIKAVKIDDDNLEKFLQEGQLGEFKHEDIR
jgi:hypothetical protein